MRDGGAAATVVKLGIAVMAGSIPFSNIVSRKVTGRDLRDVSTGTVSPTNVYQVAGTLPFAVACLLECGKGAVVATVVRNSRPGVTALAAGLTVAGHNWSPFLKGAGGRGVLPALGFMLVAAPQGAALFGGALAVGYPAGDTAPACLAAQLLLTPVLKRAYGWPGAVLGMAVTTPMLLKRLMGNQMPADGQFRDVLVTRVIYDRDAR